MRITFTQSGGFAGLVRHVHLDAATLDAAERREVERLVAARGLTESWERFAGAARDLKQYEIVIDSDAATRRICCDDRCLPEPARPLVQYLAARTRPGPPAAPAPAAEATEGTTAAMQSTSPWGRFDGTVVARWHDDGRAMTLVAPFAYVDPRAVRWTAPSGAVVNGASIPRAFWSLVGGPFEGRFRNASVVHDVACAERTREWRDVHRMFHDACRCGGVGVALANTMFYAVWHFGPRWRFEERRGIVAGRPVLERVAVLEPVPEPAPELVRQVADWFMAHDVAADTIPTLPVPPR
ncbi:MAG: protealysin inhibitor emfourin [Planctomycetia bacterium]